MIAKEMFEELGYEELKCTVNCKQEFHYEQIDKRRCCRNLILGVYFVEYMGGEGGEVQTNVSISKEILKAINKQCQELGWLDD